MTAKQAELVQQSWQLVKPLANEAGLDFYRRLFAAAPGIRHLFKDDVSEQAAKLMRMIAFVVGKLHRFPDIVDDIELLAATHNRYGARPEHYSLVGQCLVETLRDGLGGNWNTELENAWIAVYTALQNALIATQEKLRTADTPA